MDILQGYDSEIVREQARERGIKPVIPRRSNSQKTNAEFDAYLYKLRHLVENLFAKLARNFKSMVYIACTLI